jgi:hypothetical protein
MVIRTCLLTFRGDYATDVSVRLILDVLAKKMASHEDGVIQLELLPYVLVYLFVILLP